MRKKKSKNSFIGFVVLRLTIFDTTHDLDTKLVG